MFIYVVWNTRNGKLYIGKTRGSVAKRWTAHVKAAEKGSKLCFHAAIRKYGIESFRVALLSSFASSVEDLNNQECYFIGKYRTYPPTLGYGYNLSPGGDGGAVVAKFKKITDATREKMSAAKRGRPLSAAHKQHLSEAIRANPLEFTPAFRKKLSERQRGAKNHNWGKTATLETRQRLSISAKIRVLNRKRNKKGRFTKDGL